MEEAGGAVPAGLPIAVLPLGGVAPESVSRLVAELPPLVGRPALALAELPLTPSWADPARRQFGAAGILRALAGRDRSGEFRSLAVTCVDLFLETEPHFRFVFGLADPLTGLAVISLRRLAPEFYGAAPDAELLASRLRIEAVHELGHTFGLRHCADRACVMSFSLQVEDSDRKGHAPCASCRARFPGAVGRGT